ncbi:HAMP domain-containing protein [Shewanella eurypsychrophilus]|uniref:histidine kinase n=1 Tax=Shewanella eurypsychrophilus TaxID=2593656 RepID=A0ABX8S3T1_9GAMM|nr:MULTISPECIES: HAMP domain-containing sensor histidine kinase [Shewanella]QFU23237.1 HAMP domain-containing protein [Shewanella sp. YLB-09]QXP44830.1 HAMP domain-containing protein [Shewanella eurypsychrophilus]
MSIKRYVFLLFGALIILLGISQLLISQYYKGELQSELSESSRALSQNLVKVLIDNVGSEQEFIVEFDDEDIHDAIADIEEARSDFQHDIEEIGHEIGQLSEEILLIETKNPHAFSPQERRDVQQALKQKQRELKNHLIEMATHEKQMEKLQLENIVNVRREARREAATSYRERLHEAVSQIEIDTNNWLEKGNVAIIEAPSMRSRGDMSFQFSREIVIPSQKTNNQLERFSESMLGLILLTSIAALIFAYVLSHFISSPLTKLAQGHQKLGDGELGFQVEEKGVKELKAILTGFNKMSSKLAQLSEKEQLMTQQQQLAELGEVTRGIAHSLRNPLHTVGLLSEGVMQAKSKEEEAELLQKIQQKIAMMDKSIQSLLTLSSNEVNRSHQVPINAIVHDILLELSITGTKPKISFDSSRCAASIHGAESEVRSILHAVLINAVEATPDDGSVEVSICSLDNRYQVIVKDSGKGILPEVRERLSQPHVTTKTEGTGMGVYIAERLIKGHYGGDIQFKDNPTGGTIVTLTFSKLTNSTTGSPS